MSNPARPEDAAADAAPAAVPAAPPDPRAAVIRTPDQRVRVFISSTLQELAAERAAAHAAIAALRLTPVLFELGAHPHPPRDLYRAYLEQSDIFVGIYWQRYGWVAPGMDISGLEDEYRLAGGKPQLIYVKVPAPEREPGLATLLARIQSASATSYQKFSSLDELRDLVENDLALLLTERFMLAQIEAAAPDAPPARTSNLPLQRAGLVGRTAEVQAARALLGRPDVGVVTLTGPGGTGKTRLALEVAAGLVESFPDGVFSVPLAPVHDPGRVAAAIAYTLDAPLGTGRSPAESLAAYLRDKRMLLVLDNFEQVTAAAPLGAELIETCPGVKILVTSRTSLHVRGERELPVPPLAVPGPLAAPLARIGTAPAVALFVQRAQDVKPDFTVTEENAPIVAEICRRLDGLPLAIELAAARVKVLPPRALLARMERRLPLLTGGARDLPARQQTMRGAIEWSYDLLAPHEQTLFRRVAVFVGGCTLDALTAVCMDQGSGVGGRGSEDGNPDALLDAVAVLVDNSLLRQEATEDAEPRFSMLGTIQEYALDRLEASGEAELIRRRHAEYFLALAEGTLVSSGAPAGGGPERVAPERNNLRAALEWAARAGEVELELRLASAIPPPFPALASRRDASPVTGSLNILGMLAYKEADYTRARALFEQSLALQREAGDTRGLAGALINLGAVAYHLAAYGPAAARWTEGLALCRDLDYREGVAHALGGLALIACAEGQLERAARLAGAVAALGAAPGVHFAPADRHGYEATLEAARVALGEAPWAAAWAAGQALSPADAIAAGLSDAGS